MTVCDEAGFDDLMGDVNEARGVGGSIGLIAQCAEIISQLHVFYVLPPRLASFCT
jgi:hypothetical protein